MTKRGFIKFDLMILSLFSALMAFLFYAGIDSISFNEDDNDIHSLFDETSSNPTTTQNSANIKVQATPSTSTHQQKTPQQQIIELQNQVAQLTLQLQKIEPAADQDPPQPIPAMKKITPQTEQKTIAATPAHTTPPTKNTVKPTLATQPAHAHDKQPSKTSAQQPTRPLHNKTWLLSQKDTHYSMQILAVRSKQELLQEIKKSSLELEPLSYYPSIRNGQVWYALLYGLFDTRAEAQHALKKLPKHIRQNKPWLRSLRAIKKAIQHVPIEAQ